MEGRRGGFVSQVEYVTRVVLRQQAEAEAGEDIEMGNELKTTDIIPTTGGLTSDDMVSPQRCGLAE